MNGNEFLRKLRRLARKLELDLRIDETHGKGSHARVWLGMRGTTLKDRRKEIGPGLLHDMCRQLGIRPEDLE